ncbi:hypothetical protein ACWEQL_32140 [Kitasatospora sp. NPDC004240]
MPGGQSRVLPSSCGRDPARPDRAGVPAAETDSGRSARLGHHEIAEPRREGGLPVFVSGQPYAVPRPAADHTAGADLVGKVVLTAGDAGSRAIEPNGTAGR